MIKLRFGVVLIIAIVLSPLFLSNARADFYKYVDADGVMHITNVPTSTKYKWMMREKKTYAVKTAAYYKAGPYSGNKNAYADIIEESAARYGIDASLVKAVVKAESDFRVDAVSAAGARGLMQLMPDTAATLGVKDIHDPEENIDGGTRHLRRLLNAFDWDLKLALAAYNAGEKAVEKYGAVPPYEETRDYVKRVLYYYRQYKDYNR